MTSGQNFEHVIFFEMSPEKILYKFCHAKNLQKELQTNGCHCQWLKWITIPETADIHW